MGLIKKLFPPFFDEAGFNKSNIDLMCALHLDKPHHLHIHFIFFEQEPKYLSNDGSLSYRKRGRIAKDAIDNMFLRAGFFIDENKDSIYEMRDKALKKLKNLTYVGKPIYEKKEIKQEILSLAKDLPSTGRLSYGSKEMEPFRGRVDKIVDMLISFDEEARKANERFYEALEEKKRIANGIRNNDSGLSINSLTNNNRIINENKIEIIDKIESDYKKRQGNLILHLCKFLKYEHYEKKEGGKYKPNDNKLKRRLNISKRNVGRRLDRFFLSFGKDSQILERDFSTRLQEIEKEIEQKRKAEDEKASAYENYKKEVNSKN